MSSRLPVPILGVMSQFAIPAFARKSEHEPRLRSQQNRRAAPTYPQPPAAILRSCVASARVANRKVGSSAIIKSRQEQACGQRRACMAHSNLQTGETNGVLLRGKGLSKTFQSAAEVVTVLDHLDFEIRRGEFIALVGESG